jgi:DNA transposition AAA+ family ATPase
MEQHTEPSAADIEALDREAEGTNGVNISRQTVTKHTEHLPEEQKLLLRWWYTIARDNRWRPNDLATFSGLDYTTLHRVWHDRYVNNATGERVPLTSLCKKLEAAKKTYLQDHPAARIGDHPFVNTSVWDRIDWLCKKVAKRKKIGFIYGESHIGKTECLLNYQRHNNHGMTAYFELPPSGGVQFMTRRLAKSLYVGGNQSFDKTLEGIVAAVDSDMLIIGDQVHRIFYSYQHSSVMRCLDTLMYIHDQTHCPMVLCGTNVWRDELREGKLKQYLKQLRRRGLYEIQLPAAAPFDDLVLIAKEYGLDAPEGEALNLASAIARNDGLAMYFTRLQDAQEMAEKKSTSLTWDHFAKAVTIAEKMANGPDRK